jgi:hypothetical protein
MKFKPYNRMLIIREIPYNRERALDELGAFYEQIESQLDYDPVYEVLDTSTELHHMIGKRIVVEMEKILKLHGFEENIYLCYEKNILGEIVE